MTDNSEQTLTLSVEEAARLLGISPGLAYELIHRGELAAIRLGRRILVPRHVIESLVNRPRQRCLMPLSAVSEATWATLELRGDGGPIPVMRNDRPQSED